MGSRNLRQGPAPLARPAEGITMLGWRAAVSRSPARRSRGPEGAGNIAGNSLGICLIPGCSDCGALLTSPLERDLEIPCATKASIQTGRGLCQLIPHRLNI